MAEMMTPADAEELAAEHMRNLGFEDAAATGGGADGGLDVNSTNAVAQVKMHFKPTGRPDLQKLFGARAHQTSKAMLFYNFAGYSNDAVKYADSVQMALFRFDLNGHVTPNNETARLIGNQRSTPAIWVAPPPRVFYSPAPESTGYAPIQRPNERTGKSKKSPNERSKWHGSNTFGETPPQKVQQAAPSQAKNARRRPTPTARDTKPTRTEPPKNTHRELLEQQQATRLLAMSSRTDELISEWEKLSLDTVMTQLAIPRKKAVHEDQLAEYVRRRREDEPETSTPRGLPLQAPTSKTSPAQRPDTEPTQTSTPTEQIPRNRSTLRQLLVDPALQEEKRRARHIVAPVFGIATIATLIPVFVSGEYTMILIPLIFAVMTSFAILFSKIPSE